MTRDCENRGERAGDGIAKAYARLLRATRQPTHLETLVHAIHHNLMLAGGAVDGALAELAHGRENAKALPEGAGKGIALCTFAEAERALASAKEHFSLAESVFLDGLGKSMERFRKGRDNALEKPFPITRLEQELTGMMRILADAYERTDLGIGRMEEAEGMECVANHYRDSRTGGIWEGGPGNQALLDILWPMRHLQGDAKFAYETAHETARYADEFRTTRRTIKKDVLLPGLFWEREKERRGMLQGQRETAYTDFPEPWAGILFPLAAEPKPAISESKVAEGGETSLRKRLREAKESSREHHKGRATRDREVQR